MEHVNLAEATDLLIGAAVASAYDDVLHGTFPLASDHLPRAVSRGPRRGWSAEQGPHGLAATTTTNTVDSSARSA